MPSEAGPGSRRPSQAPLRPLGLSSGKWLGGLQCIPAAERVAAQALAVPNSGPETRARGSQGGWSRGRRSGPAPARRGGGIALPVGGVAARAPPPHPPARVKCGRRLCLLQLPGSPQLGHAARAVTCSNCPGGSARRLRSAAAPPSCLAVSGESKGLGELRGLRGSRRPARPGDRT